MRDSFLINRFLASRSGVFRRPEDPTPGPSPFRADDLARRFERRAMRHRARRRSYFVGIQFSTAAALLVVLGVTRISFTPGDRLDTRVQGTEAFVLEDIQPTRHVMKPPPPPPPPLPVEVPDDVVLEEVALALDSEISFDEPLDVPPPPPPADTYTPEPDIFVVVQEQPEMIGGMAQLMEDLVYPPLAIEAGLQGTVVVQIVIDEEGRPTRPNVLKPVNKLLDKAAVEALMKQRFTPARQQGRAVKVFYSVPVRFRLTV